MSDDPTVQVIYHGNCPDGFCAAWVAWSVLGRGAEYTPSNYGLLSKIRESVDTVYILDFSYPRSVVEDLARKKRRVVILDHHKTAAEDLAGLPYAIFDMERSGATLAWQYFMGDAPAPKLVRYVEDSDLWRFALPSSRAVRAWVSSHVREFTVWNQLAETLEEHFGTAVQEGNVILRDIRVRVNLMCEQAKLEMIGGYTVPVVNASVFFSETAEALLSLFPDAPFSAYYFDRKDGFRQYGLRSRGDFDVSVVAQQLGGGGHKAAAGFTKRTT